MKKEVIRFEVRTRIAHTNYVFNPATKEFDDEACVFESEKYSWKTQEEMLNDFFKDFNPKEFKNSLDANIQLCKVTEIWTREDVEDDWDFYAEESTVIIEFNIYDWLKNNGYEI